VLLVLALRMPREVLQPHAPILDEEAEAPRQTNRQLVTYGMSLGGGRSEVVWLAVGFALAGFSGRHSWRMALLHRAACSAQGSCGCSQPCPDCCSCTLQRGSSSRACGTSISSPDEAAQTLATE